MIASLLLLLASPAAQAATPPATKPSTRPNPRSASIAFAGGGGLRDWQPDPADGSSLYVRDRTLRWYHVRLSGDCPRVRTYDAMGYTTDPTGRFDTFSIVTFGRPIVRCGVMDIQPSAPPASIRSRPKH